MGRRSVETRERLEGVEARVGVVVLRHSVKGDDGELTDEGRRLAAEYWNDVFLGDMPQGDGKIFHSEIGRSRETAEIVGLGLSGVTLVEDSRLSESPYTDEAIARAGLSGGLWLREDKASDDLPGASILAERMAAVVMEMAEGLGEVPDGEEEVVFCVSHVPAIMLFLKHALSERWGDGDKILQELGGFTKVLHGFQLLFERRENEMGARILVDVFDGNEFLKIEESLDINKLKDLAALSGRI